MLRATNFLINPRLGLEAIDRRDEQSVHAARKQPPEAGFLAFGLVVGVREQHVVAEFVGAFLDGEHDARVNRVRVDGMMRPNSFVVFVRNPCALESGT